MRSIAVLAALAARLNRAAAKGRDWPAIPSLYFFTDPMRTPDPLAIALRLPRGAAIVFRHFGMSNRLALARALKRVCRARGLKLLIGADPKLARLVAADGVHWPERKLPARRQGFALELGAAHSPGAIARAEAAGLDACVLSPVLESRSASAGKPLGAERAGFYARRADIPIIALGGVNAKTARQLTGRGFAGLAAIDAFLEDLEAER